ncbi:hypothetical protein GLAREA_10129 [Glarea lozoyensis ATCC 20868]|uniref:Uncharacterized protein n=1 Tax=Glarea lozoyensis (strain ATCC 20868 / MF5171) TaxID=1116229 RepID=S3D9L5_GLAL2|nr:uncharacterized protein GLAREA_10129 [Glarea lozoyensis ATCC 20868]EPE34435.1 hypothetical protein GLAREA_10129 [Glarea lozoyensis ATCC 20868]
MADSNIPNVNEKEDSTPPPPASSYPTRGRNGEYQFTLHTADFNLISHIGLGVLFMILSTGIATYFLSFGRTNYLAFVIWLLNLALQYILILIQPFRELNNSLRPLCTFQMVSLVSYFVTTVLWFLVMVNSKGNA